MASPFFVAIICIFSSFLCNGQQNVSSISKSEIVEGILQKVFNLTLASFSNIPASQRGKMMEKIEAKLNKSAQSLGQSNGKYVALIMEGVKSITQKQQWPTHDDDYTKASENKVLRIKDNIAFQGTEHYKLPTKNYNALKNINLKKNGGLIERKLHKRNSKITTEKNEARRMEFEFIDNINVNKNNIPQVNRNNQEIFQNYEINNVTRGDDDMKSFFDPNSVTLQLPCHNEIKIVCKNIKKLRTIQCTNRVIAIEKLCDGVNDCEDNADERNCTKRAVEKVRNASLIISDIERSIHKKCFSSEFDDLIIAKQNEVLQEVLERQLSFIEKHSKQTIHYPFYVKRSNTKPQNVEKTVSEVANVISSLSSGLEDTLCSRNDEYRKFNDIDTDVEMAMLQTSTWTPRSCSCVEKSCIEECAKECESICLQKYNLARWQCKAIDGNATIPLDLICDGKLDCTDEDDENNCTSGAEHPKFEAAKIYSMIIELISKKIKSSSFMGVQRNFLTLQRLVKELQTLSSERNIDIAELKSMRDQCFAELVAIYEQNRYYAPSMSQVNDIFVFLLSLNERLVMALKLSHSGNVRLMAPGGCFCREGKCALLQCSKTCIRACSGELKLTRYRCPGSNITLPLESLCNGIRDCFGGDDEKNCNKEVICRSHHLFVLRHNLESHESDATGTSVGESIKLWKTQVAATLKVANSYDRPGPKLIRHIVSEILHDLVMAYAGLEVSARTRRSEEYVIQQFYEMSLIVMNTLKSCGK